MKNFNFFTGVLKRLFNGDNSIKISKSSKSYQFILNEYPNRFSMDSSDSFIIPVDREKHVVREHKKIINLGTQSYGYFACEYRTNPLCRDLYGNIILSDDIVKTR